jgi:hypothetical protein
VLADGSPGIDWTDRRKLEDLPFGAVFPESERASISIMVNETLHKCGVEIAEDISKLGCTGLAAAEKNNIFSIDDGVIAFFKRVRLGVGGSGCTLPCFVPPTRYCLVHETIGGLQEGQAQCFPEMVEKVSRELRPHERKHVEVVESARRVEARTENDRLNAARDIVMGEDAEEEAPDSDLVKRSRPRAEVLPPPWVCPEHGATFWACRFCVAAEIARGDLEPSLLLSVPLTTPGVPPEIAGRVHNKIASEHVEQTVRDAPHDEAELYVRVARWRRKLARD